MRFWPSRRRRVVAAPPPVDLTVTEDLVRGAVEEVFAVHHRELARGGIVFRGELRLPPARAVDLLERRLRPFGFTPFLRAEGNDVLLHAIPVVEPADRPRVAVNVLLFVLTCASTLVAGASFSGSPTFDAFRTSPAGTYLVAGLPFAATLLAILGVHEFGHYFTARHYRAAVSLPYFIPAPPPLFIFGTLGAIIRMRSLARDRNSLFDIAAAGPLAGLVVAIPAMILGLQWSTVMPAQPGLLLFGDSLLRRLFVYLQFGAIPDGMMVFTHPIADAAWAGFFVTALNLFPVGQLDGGRLAYALFGRHHRAVGIVTVAATLLLGLATMSPNWFVWAALVVLLIGFRHSPPLDDVTPLSARRRVVGLLCLVLFVLLVPPIPLEFG